MSNLGDVLQSDFYESPVGCDNIDWCVNEVKKVEKKIVFHFKNTKKDIIMKEEDERKY